MNFDPAEFKVVSGQNVNLAMKERLTQLNDVVVVGYGRSSRKNLSSAVSTIKSEDLNPGRHYRYRAVNAR